MEIDLEDIKIVEEVTGISVKGLSLSLDNDGLIISIIHDEPAKSLALEMSPAAKRNIHRTDLKQNASEQPCVFMMNGNENCERDTKRKKGGLSNVSSWPIIQSVNHISRKKSLFPVTPSPSTF